MLRITYRPFLSNCNFSQRARTNFPYLAVIDRFSSTATIFGRSCERRRVFLQAGNIRPFGNARKSIGFTRYGVEAADNAAPCEYFA